MNLDLQQMLAEATRLTRAGNLQEATVAIQAALRAGTPASSASPAFQPAFPPGFDAASVIDIEARRIDTEPVDRSAPRPAAARLVQGQFIAGRHSEAGLQRDYKLYIPPGHHEGRLPLVVMLHGCTQDPDDFAAGTRMNALAEARGFFVLYPEQAARSNANRCWNWFAPADQKRGGGEPALIAGMVRHVAETHDIDADRIYVAGLSAGGAMAAILAHEYSDLFAAAGVHSGLKARAAHDVTSAFSAMKSGPAGNAASPSTASAPVIVFHGSGDATVAPANGDAVIAAVLASGARPVRSEAPVPGKARRSARRFVWHAEGAGPEAPSLAEQWLVDGAPHAWSGGAAAGSYTDPGGPDASAEMLRFFLEHPRRPVL